MCVSAPLFIPWVSKEPTKVATYAVQHHCLKKENLKKAYANQPVWPTWYYYSTLARLTGQNPRFKEGAMFTRGLLDC